MKVKLICKSNKISLGTQLTLEEGMATHSSILAWRIPKDRGALEGYSLWGHKELDATEQRSIVHPTNTVAYCAVISL